MLDNARYVTHKGVVGLLVQVECRVDRVRECVFLVVEQPTDLAAKISERDRGYVIACHGAGLLEPIRDSARNLCRKPTNRGRDRRDGDCVEMRADEFARKYKHRSGLV